MIQLSMLLIIRVSIASILLKIISYILKTYLNLLHLIRTKMVRMLKLDLVECVLNRTIIWTFIILQTI